MAVYTHLQILPYYAKPNNILEGNIVNADVTQFGNRWVWEGKNHLLVAGRFNMLTGYIEGAILREYLRYDDLWADVPEVERPSVQTSSRTNAETTGTGASSQPTSYTNTTNVTIGLGGSGEGGAAYLNDLLDVNAENVVTGSVLYFNGSQWEDRSLPVWLEELLEKSAFLASLWQVDPLTGEMFTTRKVHIKEDLYADGEVSGGGEGEEGEGDTDLTEVFTRLEVAEQDIADIQSVLDNIGEIGAFLPLTGGTISSDYEEAPLKIATTAYEWVALRLKTKTSAVGGSLVYVGGSEWKVTDDGWNQSYALLHEGNFTNYALSKSGTAADSDKLKGKNAWEYFQRYGSIKSQSDMDALDKAKCGVYQTNYYSPVEGAYNYGQLLNFHDIAGVAQIYFADFNRGVYVRYNWNGYSQDVGSWKRLAYTTDNVASADIAKTAEALATISTYSGGLLTNNHKDGVLFANTIPNTDVPWSVGYSNAVMSICRHAEAEGYITQLGFGNNGMYYRAFSNQAPTMDAEWKTFAFLDSNVASADMAWSLRSLGFMTDFNIQTKNGLYKYNGEALNRPNNFGLLLQLSNKDNPSATDGSSWIYQMAYDTTAVRIMVRQSTNGSAWSNWKTLAFTDGNVASATKLATSRKIWGQSFDGSADISGALYMPNGADIAYRDTNDKILAILGVTPANQLAIGYGMADNNYTTILYGGTIRLQHRTNVIGFILNSSGNVGIGTSDPAYKLDVNGNLATKGDLRVREGSCYLQNDKSLRCYLNGNSTDMDVFRVSTSNEIEIGGDAPSYGVNTIIKGKKIILRQNIWDTRLEIAENGDTYINKNLNLAETAYINGEIYLGNDAEGIFYYKSIPRLCYHNQGTWVSNLITFEHNRITIHQHLALANALYVDTIGNGFMMAGTDYYSYIARTEDGQWKEDIFNFYPNGDNYAFGKFIFSQLIRAEQGIKIGDATITWDSANNALKIDGNVYATGEMAAGGTAN